MQVTSRTARLASTIAALSLLSLAACGGGDGPVGPGQGSTLASIAAPAELTIYLGESYDLAVEGRDAQNGHVAIPNAAWQSTAPAGVSVSGTGATATLKGESLVDGVTVTVKSGSVQAQIRVRVTPLLTKRTLTTIYGTSAQLEMPRTTTQWSVPTDAGTISATGTFTAAGPGAATQSYLGSLIVTGAAVKTVKAVARQNGAVDTLAITLRGDKEVWRTKLDYCVQPNAVTRYAILKTSSAVPTVVRPATGDTVATGRIAWASADTSVASVDDAGLLAVKAVGKTNVTATLLDHGNLVVTYWITGLQPGQTVGATTCYWPTP